MFREDFNLSTNCLMWILTKESMMTDSNFPGIETTLSNRREESLLSIWELALFYECLNSSVINTVCIDHQQLQPRFTAITSYVPINVLIYTAAWKLKKRFLQKLRLELPSGPLGTEHTATQITYSKTNTKCSTTEQHTGAAQPFQTVHLLVCFSKLWPVPAVSSSYARPALHFFISSPLLSEQFIYLKANSFAFKRISASAGIWKCPGNKKFFPSPVTMPSNEYTGRNCASLYSDTDAAAQEELAHSKDCISI